MANGQTVARSIRAFRDRTLPPAALSAVLASTARRARDELIASGEAAPSYQTAVDGRLGASEDSVRPNGTIVYRFNLLPDAVGFAVAYCIARSPVLSGDYRRAWSVAVDGKPWPGDIRDIPSGAEVMVFNPMPYARKIDTGAMRMSVPPGIVEGARQAVRRKFSTINASRTFLALPPGDYRVPAGVQVPYVLKGHAKRRRKDTARGMTVTYPGLVLASR